MQEYGFDSWQGPAQPHIQRVLDALSSGVKWFETDLVTCSAKDVWDCTVTLPYVSWRGA